jgi:hypothetical protein
MGVKAQKYQAKLALYGEAWPTRRIHAHRLWAWDWLYGWSIPCTTTDRISCATPWCLRNPDKQSLVASESNRDSRGRQHHLGTMP